MAADIIADLAAIPVPPGRPTFNLLVIFTFQELAHLTTGRAYAYESIGNEV